MSGTTTPNYGFSLPAIGGNQDSWGNLLNANWTAADSVIHGLASGYLPLSGGTMSGGITIAPASGYAFLTLNKPTGANANQIEGATAGAARWVVLLGNAEAESGGNAGSNFSVGRFDDGGNLLGAPVSISRATGNVAIAQALSVAGAVTGSGQVSANSIQSTSGVFQVAPNYYLGRGSDAAWRFVENGITNLSVDVNGNAVARGTVTAGINVVAPGGVYANSGNIILGPSTGGSQLQYQSGWYWDWNSGNGNLGWNTPAGLFWFFRITDGNSYNQLGPVGGVGAYQNNSDARGKEDIADTTTGLAEILRLRPVTFKRKPRLKAQTPTTELGFIAQELREVIPEAVSVVGFELPDGSGGIDSSDPTLATTLDPIVAALVNCCKELAARVADLEALRLEGQS